MKHLIWFVLNVGVRVIKWIWIIYEGKSRMSQFELALQYILAREGGLKEQVGDPGGITNRGISFRFLKSIPPERLRLYDVPMYICADDVRHLTTQQVKALYKGEFWDHAPFERINNQDCCDFVFDMAVDMGIAPAVKCLQRALWAARGNRRILVDDGILGEDTLKQVNWTDAVLLLSCMRSERGGEYRLVAQANPAENMDLDGWLNRSYNHST